MIVLQYYVGIIDVKASFYMNNLSQIKNRFILKYYRALKNTIQLVCYYYCVKKIQIKIGRNIILIKLVTIVNNLVQTKSIEDYYLYFNQTIFNLIIWISWIDAIEQVII